LFTSCKQSNRDALNPHRFRRSPSSVPAADRRFRPPWFSSGTGDHTLRKLVRWRTSWTPFPPLSLPVSPSHRVAGRLCPQIFAVDASPVNLASGAASIWFASTRDAERTRARLLGCRQSSARIRACRGDRRTLERARHVPASNTFSARQQPSPRHRHAGPRGPPVSLWARSGPGEKSPSPPDL
jgi:hypothetical protein